MENNMAIIEKIEKHSRIQLWFTGALCILCIVSLICMLVLTASITGAANEILTLVEPLQEVTAQVQDMAQEADTVMGNLNTVTQALADADLGSMVDNVNALTADSQTVVTAALEKLDTIDIDTLNKAIEDLADVVEPLAKVSNFFG